MRRLLLVVGVIALIVAAIATLNRIVDPEDEFYSGDALSAALASNCLIAYDVAQRSYPELKRDLFRRKHPTRVVLSSDGVARPGLELGFPGFGPDETLTTMRYLAESLPERRKLRIAIVTEPAWFDPKTPTTDFDESDLSKLGYLVSPSTLGSTLDLMRESRTLAFTGWQKEQAGRRCVVDRGSPTPAFRLDGTFSAPTPRRAASSTFAFERLTPVDEALALAERRGWRVTGLSTLPGSPVYQRELKALFAKHGYRWRIRRLTA